MNKIFIDIIVIAVVGGSSGEADVEYWAKKRIYLVSNALVFIY